MLFAGLLAEALSGCQSGVVIDIRVTDRPADASALFVSAWLDGTPALAQSQPLSPPKDHFQVRLEDVTTGQVKLQLSTQNNVGCENASGESFIPIVGSGTYSARVSLAPQAGCSLAVEVVGPGSGRVSSAPVGIDCGSDCADVFPRNQLVSLTRSSSDRFGGWSTDASQSACSGRTSCTLAIGSGTTRVRASFIRAASCATSDWCREEGVTAAGSPANLYAIWGSARDDVWVVGDQGTLLHGDGLLWRQVASPTRGALRGVWGSGPADVYAVGALGTILHFDGTAWSALPAVSDAWLTAVWGTSRDNVWIVGDGGTILHGGRAGFAPVSAGTTLGLRGIWGGGARDIWAVGDAGVVLRYRGAIWESVRPAQGGGSLYAVWGSAADNVWMVGDAGLVLRFSGRIPLEEMRLPGTTGLHAVWGPDFLQTWVVGDKGGIWKWDGAAWSPMPSTPSTNQLAGLWGSSGIDIWAVGQALTLVRYRP